MGSTGAWGSPPLGVLCSTLLMHKSDLLFLLAGLQPLSIYGEKNSYKCNGSET